MEPALLKEQREEFRELLAGAVTYTGESLDPDWSEEEAWTRWEKVAPDKLLEDPGDLLVLRTDHYIIFTNQGKGTTRSFGKVMEECYEKIRTVFPFEDIKGQRLMPLFLFRTDEQYVQFLVKAAGMTEANARRTAGVAFGDCYATSFASKTDPVHIHEATHQIFRNRLFLGGGGSWYQEGAAEYIENEPNVTTVVRNLVGKGRGLDLREMMQMRSLLFSSSTDRVDGSSAAGEAYKQAGLLMEYIRQSDDHKENFLDYIHAVGRVGRNDMPAIERAIQQTLGVSVEELNEGLIEYCKGRQRKIDRFKPIRLKSRR